MEGFLKREPCVGGFGMDRKGRVVKRGEMRMKDGFKIL